jgi:hypothetical protein
VDVIQKKLAKKGINSIEKRKKKINLTEYPRSPKVV